MIHRMARFPTSSGAGTTAALVFCLALLVGCAPRVANAPATTQRGPTSAVSATPVPTMIDAVIVDVRTDVRVLTVKEDRTHETWMVSLPDPVRISGAGRPDMRCDELTVGDHVRISGTSSIDLILKADTIELLDNVPRP
jgi:hypothetical protein